MSKSHIVVTGGAGYIGSHVCKQLAQKGYVPVVLDNLSSGYQENVQWGPFVKGDIRDLACIQKISEKYNPSAIMHFAAFINVGESVANPAKYYDNNVAASIAFFSEAVRLGIQHLVFSSTAAVYGNPNTVPIPEDHPCAPVNPYGQGKLDIENMLTAFAGAYKCKTIIFRFFNAAGADPGGAVGEDHRPETHLIPLVFAAFKGKIPEITVFGDDYATPDGTCVRDYIHVADLAQAHVRGLDYLLAGGDSQIFNLGNGNGYSVREVIETVEQVIGKPVPQKIGPRRQGDPAILVADSTKARSVLNWEPQFAELKTIVSHAWQWYQKRFD